MISIILGIVTFVTLFFLVKKWRKEGVGVTYFLAVLLGVFAFAFSDVIAMSVVYGTSAEIQETTEMVASQEIVVLNDSSATSGQFFLGSGSVNNTHYYAFYVKTENGYKYETLEAESSRYPVYIKYITSEAEAPHIDRYALIERQVWNSHTDPLWFSILAHFLYGSYEAGDVISEETHTTPALYASSLDYYDNFRYEIYIPEGSIRQDYIIDLE